MEEAVNEKPRCFNLWKAGSVGLKATAQLRMHPNAQTRSEAEKFAL